MHSFSFYTSEEEEEQAGKQGKAGQAVQDRQGKAGQGRQGKAGQTQNNISRGTPSRATYRFERNHIEFLSVP